jgi:hypothetical protein
MLTGFYGAFSPACLALLGLWLVVVQVRMREWQGSATHRRRSYGVALIFALPGVMSRQLYAHRRQVLAGIGRRGVCW